MTLEHLDIAVGGEQLDQLEVAPGQVARRRWTPDEKRSLVETAMEPGSSFAEVGQCFGVAPAQLYAWRKQLRDGELDPGQPSFAMGEVSPSGEDYFVSKRCAAAPCGNWE